MGDFADDFEEVPEEEESGPVLPREDRLWRHPSELSSDELAQLDPIAVRRRWLQTQPTRASAWTAGLVGALLATGLVVLGTHLGSALTGGGTPAGPSLSSVTIPTVTSPSTLAPSLLTLGRLVSRAVARTAGAMGAVVLDTEGQYRHEVALAVNASGFLIMPSAGLSDASSVLVTMNGVEYVGEAVGYDPSLGVALLHINGAGGLPTARFATQGDPNLAVAITSAQGTTAVTSLSPLRGRPAVDGQRVSDPMATDLPPTLATTGTVLLDGSGRVAGMVIGTSRGRVIAVSGARLALSVRRLVGEQVFSAHGLGLTDESAVNGPSGGARIVSVARDSSGEQAGLSVGDVVVGVNGVTVTSKATFERALRDASPSAPLVLTVVNRTASRTVIVPASVAPSP